jgi:hypothetical protein
MRISTWLRLSVLCFLAGSLSASPLAARSPHPSSTKVFIHEEFTGYGKTEKIAQKDALERACNWLKESSGLDWVADPDYLLMYKMVQFCDPEERKFDDPMGDMKVVKLRLEIQEHQVLAIQKQVQQQRMKERQKPTFLVLLGAMGLLAVVGGYLRLEEATKGYYTRLLRIAAISALVVLVAGLCVAG